MDFATLTGRAVQKVEYLLNNHPRKTLNFKTPNQVFTMLANHHTNDALHS
jgi:IS30 family transposase